MNSGIIGDVNSALLRKRGACSRESVDHNQARVFDARGTDQQAEAPLPLESRACSLVDLRLRQPVQMSGTRNAATYTSRYKDQGEARDVMRAGRAALQLLQHSTRPFGRETSQAQGASTHYRLHRHHAL